MPITMTKVELKRMIGVERRKAVAGATVIRKVDVDKLLVKERKTSRQKAQQSKFMLRTGSMYNSQKKRAAETKKTLPYTMADLRALVTLKLSEPCPYSGDKLSVVNMALDHGVPLSRGGSWELDNLILCTQQSNFRKGSMTDTEFKKFDKGLRKSFPPEVVEDVYRRLTLGGKWMRSL